MVTRSGGELFQHSDDGHEFLLGSRNGRRGGAAREVAGGNFGGGGRWRLVRKLPPATFWWERERIRREQIMLKYRQNLLLPKFNP